MEILIWEYLFFLTAVFVVLVSSSAASLFFVAYRYEKKSQTFWRAFGFTAIALAFIMLILDRKYPVFTLPALLFQLVGFYSIFRDVKSQLNLAQLNERNKKSPS